MKRRSLIQGAAASALGFPHLMGFAQQAVTLKFHTFMAPLSNVWLTMHKPWMEKVEKDSGGRIKFEAYPAMQLGEITASVPPVIMASTRPSRMSLNESPTAWVPAAQAVAPARCRVGPRAGGQGASAPPARSSSARW